MKGIYIMTVVCKMSACQYCGKDGFCEKELVNIDENGMCKMLWKRGQQIPLDKPHPFLKRTIEVEDAIFKDIAVSTEVTLNEV